MKLSLNLEDISQITIGAFALAVPISFSEEAWKLGDTLPLITEPATTFKRLIIITMPASMGAIIIDRFEKPGKIYD